MNYRFDVELDKGEILVGVNVTSATRGYSSSWDDPGCDDEIEFDIEYVCIGDENGDTITLQGDEALDWLSKPDRFEDVDTAVYEYMNREQDDY